MNEIKIDFEGFFNVKSCFFFVFFLRHNFLHENNCCCLFFLCLFSTEFDKNINNNHLIVCLTTGTLLSQKSMLQIMDMLQYKSRVCLHSSIMLMLWPTFEAMCAIFLCSIDPIARYLGFNARHEVFIKCYFIIILFIIQF